MIRCFVTIKPESERSKWWLEVFGSLRVPVLSPVPIFATGPEPGLYYRMDVKELDAEQRQKVIAHIAEKWQLPRAEVERSLDDPQHGLPIFAEEVIPPAIDMRLLT